jgi:hypothetical protein
MRALSGVTRWIQSELSRGVRTGTGITNLRPRPRSDAMMSMSARYVSTSGPPMSSVRPAVSGTSRQRTRYSSTFRTAIGWLSVETHFGVTMTGSRSTR